jgi:HAE1 family hydrophobic/amphiphilic exporter-1
LNLSRWAIRFPVTVSMVMISVLVLGGLSVVKLPLAFLPEVDFPGIGVEVPYKNSLPAQIEEEITRPIEEALSTLSGVRRIFSYADADQTFLWIELDWGTDIGPLRVEAREKIDRIRDELPADVDQIYINSFRSSDIPVLVCRISADRDLSRQYELLNRHVADPLRRIPGVAKVELYGVDPPEVQVNLDLDAVKRHNVDVGLVLARIEASNRSMSAGQLRREDETWPLRVVNRFSSLEEINNLPINQHGLKLGDVATIEYREPELNYGRHLNDTRAIGLNIIKDSNANAVEVAQRAWFALAEMERDPALEGIEVITFEDQAEEITNSIRGLMQSGIIGALLATGILFFFLRRLTATLVVALAIPFSLLASAAILYFTGRTLNILSMMGLMLAVGLVVDNAVVVLESIYRYRQKGKGRLKSALLGSKEVMPAVVCSTATSIIVFLPLAVGSRSEISTWLGEVGRTIIFTLMCSLFLSLTAIPLFMGRFLRGTAAPRSRFFDRLTDFYTRILKWTLRHRVATLAIAMVVIVTAAIPFSQVDKSAFTGTRVQDVDIEYEFTDNVNHEEAERYVTKVESWILARLDSLHVKSTYSWFTDNHAVTLAFLSPGFADDEGAQETREMLREGLPEMPGVTLDFGGEDNNGGGGPAKMRVRIFGDPGPRMEQLADEVKRRLALVDGLTDVKVGGAARNAQEVEVVVRRDQAALYGLSTGRVATSVATFFRGRPLARYKAPDGEVEVRAQLAKKDRESLDRLKEMPMVGDDGQVVPLAAVADFQTVDTPSRVFRQQRRSVTVVSGNYSAKEGGKVRKAVSKEMDAMHFPTGYFWSFGYGFEEESQTQQEMMINLLLALALVYLVMAGLFESLLHPFAIMLALPFAFVGIAWTSFLTGSPFNLMAQIGLLILVGIVVNNGIVLIFHVHQLRERGIERRQALLDAARDRMRPILMTTATTVLGLLPLAIGQNRVGDVLYFPLARTVIGGLLSSTLLTLVLVPCFYTMIEDLTNFTKRLWKMGPKQA